MTTQLYLIGTCYLALLCEFYVVLRSFLYVRRERRQQRDSYFPKVAVLAPHYGWDEETEQNVRQLLCQDYSGDYQIYFVTHAIDNQGADISFQYLKQVTEDASNTQVLLAPNVVDNGLPRSQKVQNLITVIDNLPSDVEIIAFVDADAFVHRTWLTNLVQPLQNSQIGATVGARLYVPCSSGIATYIEAAWINFQIALQANPAITMVWGGSNAVRRHLIEDGQVISRWSNATIEDHNLTHAVKDLKQKIHFVPDCITLNRTADRTWKQIFEFTNRQMIMTFWMGHRKQWIGTLIGSLPKTLILLLALPGLFLFGPVPLSLVFLVPFLEIQCYRLTFRSLPEWLRSDPEVLGNIRRSSFVAPISTGVAAFNSIWTLFKNEIVWGGVRYKILSATTSQVLGRVQAD